MPDQPNVLLIMADQFRGDAVGADPNTPTTDGQPVVHTPTLDHFVENGALFSRMYSPAPVCVPARQCLWAGQTPSSIGCTNWYGHEWDFEHTLPGELSKRGYQTQLVGKTHSQPRGNHFGFEQVGPLHVGNSLRDDDYSEWLRDENSGKFDKRMHGLEANSWTARPSHLPEYQHPTTWTTDQALNFLSNRDTDRPFFLTLSYVRPHPPFDPPQVYWDMYINNQLPKPSVGKWENDIYSECIPEYPSPSAWCADLSTKEIHRARAAYYGLITQVDYQIQRLFESLRREFSVMEETIIVFLSDHGEMLGDHYHWRKGYPYEGSARVPLLFRFPESMEHDREQLINRPVGLEDVMPTILDLIDEEIPDTVDGRSLLDLIDNPERSDWREFYHGELGPTYDNADAMQYIVDEKIKYIWNPITGDELLFDLSNDPEELHNLAADSEHTNLLMEYRSTLATHLRNRPEGFSDGDDLSTVDPEEIQ